MYIHCGFTYDNVCVAATQILSVEEMSCTSCPLEIDPACYISPPFPMRLLACCCFHCKVYLSARSREGLHAMYAFPQIMHEFSVCVGA